jgi:hypothetical protein
MATSVVARPETPTVARRLVERFVSWLDAFGEHSHDPYDFWASPRGVRAKRYYYRSGLMGTLAAAPFVALDSLLPSSRKLVSSPRRYPIADAHFAIGFFRLAELTDDARAEQRGEHFLLQLERTRCPGFEAYCWGYPFDWETRDGLIAAQTPLMTTVPYAYEAFEAGYEATGEPAYLAVMQSIAVFAAERIPVTEVAAGAAAAAYAPCHPCYVVNASAYRGYLLAVAGQRFGQSQWMAEAERNIAFVLNSQRTDGSWPYSARPGNESFVDNVHTCFVLKNLLKFWRATGRRDVLDSIQRGYGFYCRRLLDNEGQPIPFAVTPRLSLIRRDLYDYAEGLNLAQLLAPLGPEADQVLSGLLSALRNDWVLPDGHFVTRRLVLGRNIVPYHRWAQAATFSALTRLCLASG